MSLNKIEITNLPAAGGDGLPVVYVAGETDGGKDTMFRLIPATPLAGDYNGDGVVDAADYTVWRDTNGSEVLLAADGDGDNIVDADDYNIWVTNYGASLPSSSVAIPEPIALVLALTSICCSMARRRRQQS